MSDMPGIGVDAHGGPVVDPTQNVLDLVAAAITRQDDLRDMEKAHLRELLTERDRRITADNAAIHSIPDMRAEYDRQLRDKESERIDAIRAVDAANVARTAEVQLAQAQALATQVATTADTLRTQVEATRMTTAAALATALAPITKSIEDLRAAQYAQQGEKSAMVDTRSTNQWSVGLTVTIVAVVFSILLGLAGTAITLSR